MWEVVGGLSHGLPSNAAVKAGLEAFKQVFLWGRNSPFLLDHTWRQKQSLRLWGTTGTLARRGVVSEVRWHWHPMMPVLRGSF